MSHDHRPFGQQMAEARRQRLKTQANEVSGPTSSSLPSGTEAVTHDALSHIIQRHLQLTDFGHIEGSEFVTSVSQMNDFIERCDKAASEILAALSPTPSGETVEVGLDESARRLLKSDWLVNIGHPDERGKRIVGFVVDHEDLELSDAVFALARIRNAALASSSASPKGDEDRKPDSLLARPLARVSGELRRFTDLLKHVVNTPGYGDDQNSREELQSYMDNAGAVLREAEAALSEASERERSSNPSKCEREGDIEDRKSDDLLEGLRGLLQGARHYVQCAVSFEDEDDDAFNLINQIDAAIGQPPGHTDLMISPEAIDEALSALSKREARRSKEGDARNAVIEECAQHLRTVADASETPSITRFFTAAAQELDALKSPSADRGGQL